MELVDELNEIAAEEIEDAALKAAKEAVKEVGGELAYEKTLREKWQAKAASLDTENGQLNAALAQKEAEERKLRQVVAVETSAIITAILAIVLMLIL